MSVLLKANWLIVLNCLFDGGVIEDMFLLFSMMATW